MRGADGPLRQLQGAEEHCTLRDTDIEELIRPPSPFPIGPEEADIAPDASWTAMWTRNRCDHRVRDIYDHDLSDVSPVILYALRKSGCCLSVLEDMLMDDDVIYDK